VLNLQKNLKRYMRKLSGLRFLALLFVVTLISCIATYAAFAEIPPFGDNSTLLYWLLNLDLIFLIWLIVIIVRNVIAIYSGRRMRLAGAQLYSRLALLFSLIAAAPAVIMMIFSLTFFHFGVQTWFSDTIRRAVVHAEAVAQAYLEEYQQNIKADILAMANDIDTQASRSLDPVSIYKPSLQTQSLFRNLQEAIIITQSGKILARSDLTFTLTFEAVPTYLLEQASQGEVIVLTNDETDKVRAIVRLKTGLDHYLIVGRSIDPLVLDNVTQAQNATSSFQQLESRYSTIQFLLMLVFIVVALLLLLMAVLVSLIVARQLVRPIGSMISASDRVRAGDFTVRVTRSHEIEEFDYLAQSFNKMTEQIDKQQKELVSANRQLDARRRHIETVLSNITAGVIAINKEGGITLLNDAAAHILSISSMDHIGKNLLQIMPDLREDLDLIFSAQRSAISRELSFDIEGDNIVSKNLLLKITRDSNTKDINVNDGALITFNDVTDLQEAQKKAAWSDVAQRIAHEIKNPLTPIQLSAERLKRKFSTQISQDLDIFDLCVDTIIRRVEDIGDMVNEFSNFARMPQAKMRISKIGPLIQGQISAYDNSFSSIGFDADLSSISDALVNYDKKQINQVLSNILQNAVDSIEVAQNKGFIDCGKIIVRADLTAYQCMIKITDNGAGLPDNIDSKSLLTPYVTHKEKGTGLGLAIVEKILHDHDATISIQNIDPIDQNARGVDVILTFPLSTV